jgi:phosphatidylinositol alpha-1,6-mannosyltransferase
MTRRPRLLIVTPDFPPARGGIQVVVDRLARGIKGFETVVIAPDAPGARALDRASSVAVRRVPGGGRLRGGRNALLNLTALGEGLRLRPDVTLSAHIVASPAAAVIRRTVGARTVQYFYAEEICAKPKLAAFAGRQADASIALSTYTAALVRATGVEPASTSLIPPGVDIPSDPSDPSEEAMTRPIILTIARMEERYKGHDVMVRALALVRAKVPDALWVVIGDGSLRAGIEKLADAYGVAGSIRFLGAVSDEQRNQWLRRARLLAMPSRLPAGGLAGEGFGIVYLEAGAYGKPVVAGNVGGAVDAVVDGQTGLLVDPVDPVAVAGAITRLLLEQDLARGLGAAGQQRAQLYAWPVIVERVERVLIEQLGESRFSGTRARASDSARTAA